MASLTFFIHKIHKNQCVSNAVTKKQIIGQLWKMADNQLILKTGK